MPRPHRRLLAAAALTAGVAASALAATPASATLSADQVPGPNVSAGRFTLPLTCKVTLPWLGNLQVLTLPGTVEVAGAMPSSLGPGQRFYLSKASGRVMLPSWLATLAPLIGASKARAVVPQVNIRAKGATPEVVNMASSPITVSNIRLTPGREISVGVPVNGYFTVGPWTAPQSGTVTLSFVNAVARVDLQTSSGFKLMTVNANCTTNPGLGLATIDVGGAPGQPDANVDANVDSFTAPPSGFDNGVISAAYRCRILGRDFTTAVALSAISPLSLPAGKPLLFQRSNGAFVFSPEAVDHLLAQGITSISGEVRSLMVEAEGATPSSLDVLAGSPVAFAPATLVRGQRAVVIAPSQGDLSVGPFQRIGSQTIRVQGGGAILALNTPSGAQQITCTPPSNPRVFIGPTL